MAILIADKIAFKTGAGNGGDYPKRKAVLEKNRGFGVELGEFSNLEADKRGRIMKRRHPSYNIFPGPYRSCYGTSTHTRILPHQP